MALTPEQRAVAAKAWWEAEAFAAQQDVNVFMRLIFRNDQDPNSAPFEQQWFHREWQDIWSTAGVSVIHGATGFGKTEQIIGHLLWRMGRQPSIRILILGKKAENASKLLAKIKRQIEHNKTLRAIFPSLREGAIWNNEKLRLATAGLDTTTNTVEVYGMDGSPQGARADIIVADDILDFENTLTEYQREKVIAFVDAAIQSRLTTTGQLHVLANAWHPEDLAFVYSKREGVRYGCYPAWDPITLELLWPSFRPMEWLEARRKKMSDDAFCRMFLCKPRDEKTRIFKADWFVAMRALGARLGAVPMRRLLERSKAEDPFDPYAGKMPILAMRPRNDFIGFGVGVDLATKKNEKKRKTDLSCFFGLGLRRDGKRQVIWVEKGRWSLDEKLDRFRDWSDRYKPDHFFVEDNAMQADIVQYTQNMPDFKTPVVGFTTGIEKWDPENGVEGIGVEMRGGQWASPAPANDTVRAEYLAALDGEETDALKCIRSWEQHLLDFSRVGHTPDDVMASYFARESILRLGNGMFQHTHADEMATPPPEAVQRRIAGLPGVVINAFPQQPPSAEPPEEVLQAFGFR